MKRLLSNQFFSGVFTLMALVAALSCQAQETFVSFNSNKSFALYSKATTVPILVNDSDYPGVLRAVKDLQQDILAVTGKSPEIVQNKINGSKQILIVGTIGKSAIIDELIRNKKLNVSNTAGKWEAFVVETIDRPVAGVDRAVVIAGSDKRGTIFGIYELSRQIGVSPWYWWADVTPQKKDQLYILPGRFEQAPVVQYRGIFINDEEPALGRWAVEKYGGFNHQFYEKVFELILRLKGNYLWPAMWWASFNSDDPLNPRIADEYGIVMSTTHHEPMMRAHAEWKTFKGGAWNYATNEEKLKTFWREGIQRMNGFESIVSLGMRGDGDMAMTEETNIALLERIVKDQRDIIQETTGKSPEETPQLWALYKEVQDYYDKGMRVPDDVTLLLCDDNWGNIRKLPSLKDKPRKGGYGIYYHFDYVGGPRNYKWLNTNSLPRVWEQMNLAYQYGATKIWLVNVGDIKPVELPMQFFLDHAWNPSAFRADNIKQYTISWAEKHFGGKHAADIATILDGYAKINARRKPELLSADTYSLTNYREAEKVVSEYHQLTALAEKINMEIPENLRDAFYQLVLHPVKASDNLHELYFTVAKNRLYASQGRATTNDLAAEAERLFKKDAELSHYYNKVMLNGKWNHMMDQTHISYTYWQQPEKDVLPEVKHVDIKQESEAGLAIEGSTLWWPQEKSLAVLPPIDVFNNQQPYLDIFNRGSKPFSFTITSEPWIKISKASGTVEKEARITISVDWKKVPVGSTRGTLKVVMNGQVTNVYVDVLNPSPAEIKNVSGHVEGNGYISIEAAHFSKVNNTATAQWTILPDHGKTLSGVTVAPVTIDSPAPDDRPVLEYTVHSFHEGDVTVHAYFSPTLNFHGKELHYAISVDDEAPQVVSLHDNFNLRAWEQAVANSIIIKSSKHKFLKPGTHTIKLYMVDAGTVLQKIVVETTGMKMSYLGPPESFWKK